MSDFRSILPENRKDSQPYAPEREASAQSGNRELRSRRASGRNGRKVASEERTNSARRAAVGRSGRAHRKTSTFNGASLGIFAIIGILLVILVPTALKLRGANRQLAETRAMQSSLEAQREELQTSVNDLKSQLDIVNTDDFIEKYAHEKLGMVRPNEILIRLEDGSVQINQEALASFEAQQSNLTPGEQAASESEATPEESVNATGDEAGAEQTNAQTSADNAPEAASSENAAE